MSRSYLFVPGDSEKKLQKAADAGADALIVDLEDSVAAGERPRARELTAEFLAGAAAPRTWVRVNPLGTRDVFADLGAVMPYGPHGIVLPKPESADAIRQLAALLGELEREQGVTQGHTRILPIVTEQPAALFRLDEYAGVSSRLGGLTWGAEDLSAAVGASTPRGPDGDWLPPYQLARSLTLFAAAAAEVAAIDTVYTDFRDIGGLADYAARARRDGFSGMLAIHPAQVPVINKAFRPSREEIERAERLIDLFADNPGAGTLELDGRMVDRPHYLQAQRILANAADRKDR